MRYLTLIIMTIFSVVLFFINVLWASPSESQISEIYTTVSGGKPFDVSGTTATFLDGNSSWTIYGAVQDKGDIYSRPSTWSVSGEYEIKIVDNPISDTMILPFSEPLPNVNASASISLQACRGEFEPASFVLRSGVSKLSNVTVGVSDLIKQGATAKIDSSNVDVRVVKCWFQAGISIDRRDDNKKRLVSELLLHDSDLVRVDYVNQVNLVRDISTKTNFNDAEELMPFDVPEKFNQQIWLTFNIPGNSPAGKYLGDIVVSFTVNGNQRERTIPVTVDVNSFELPAPPIECALFYLARYIPASAGYTIIGTRGKSPSQMLAEFKDMYNHGLTNVTMDHLYSTDSAGQPDFSQLVRELELFRQAGFNSKRMLYLDWNVTEWNDLTRYREKIIALKEIANQFNFEELFVYGKDESSYDVLKDYSNAFKIVHEYKGKNFVACLDRSTALSMAGLLDIAILPRDTSLDNFFTPNDNLCINSDMGIDFGGLGVGWTSSDVNFLYIDAGRMKKKQGKYVYFAQPLPMKKGVNYELSYKISSLVNAKGFILAKGGNSCVDNDIYLPHNSGVNSVEFIANGNGTLRFAAGTSDQFELDDIVVKEVSSSVSSNIEPWAYNGPQCGKEVPGTYKDRFGKSLVIDGYLGVCNYAYQAGECWDDWSDSTWRPHVMAYPTFVKPIPTLQWEGWREGIDTLRYNAVTTTTDKLSAPQNLIVQ